MKYLATIFLLLSGMYWGNPLFAQKSADEGKGQFSWKLLGRVFFDGGVINRDSTVTSFQVNDLRMGVSVHFLDYWDGKIELGYGDSKISLKDVYVDYARGAHLVRLGYYFEPFGNARVGTANYRFMAEPVADKILGDKRKLGISYDYHRERMNVTAGVFSGGDIEKSKPLNQGYIFAAKWVGRPLMKDKKLIHIGVAPRFSSTTSEVSYGGGAPTDLLSKGENSILAARVDRVINQWKLDLEVILLYNKWYAQGRYFQSHLNRSVVRNYNAKGGYVQAGYMILGEKHNYNPATGMIANPAPGSLEALVRYDNVDLNSAGILGGKLTNVSLGMNYFINKYVAAKVNYSRVMPDKTAPGGDKNYDVFQARIQLSF